MNKNTINNIERHMCLVCNMDINKFGFNQCETCLNLGMNIRNGNYKVKAKDLGIFCLARVLD